MFFLCKYENMIGEIKLNEDLIFLRTNHLRREQFIWYHYTRLFPGILLFGQFFLINKLSLFQLSP